MKHAHALRTLPLALAAALALVAGGCPGKGGKNGSKSGPAVVKIDWRGKWDKITAKGEEGKHFIKQGLSKVQSATTPEARDKGYRDIVDGLNTISKAVREADDLIALREEKNPGEHYPEWEETVVGWSEEASKARKNLPDEYIELVD